MTQGSRAFLKVGVPLFALTVTGFYGLSHLVQGKFDVQVSNAYLAQHQHGQCDVCDARASLPSMSQLEIGCTVSYRRRGRRL